MALNLLVFIHSEFYFFFFFDVVTPWCRKLFIILHQTQFFPTCRFTEHQIKVCHVLYHELLQKKLERKTCGTIHFDSYASFMFSKHEPSFRCDKVILMYVFNFSFPAVNSFYLQCDFSCEIFRS